MKQSTHFILTLTLEAKPPLGGFPFLELRRLKGGTPNCLVPGIEHSLQRVLHPANEQNAARALVSDKE
jgi:hypothetical protein